MGSVTVDEVSLLVCFSSSCISESLRLSNINTVRAVHAFISASRFGEPGVFFSPL